MQHRPGVVSGWGAQTRVVAGCIGACIDVALLCGFLFATVLVMQQLCIATSKNMLRPLAITLSDFDLSGPLAPKNTHNSHSHSIIQSLSIDT
jgi:hypothetical protein